MKTAPCGLSFEKFVIGSNNKVKNSCDIYGLGAFFTVVAVTAELEKKTARA